MRTTTNASILALDIGSRRVGVAIAGAIARLPRPLSTLDHDEVLWKSIAHIVRDEEVMAVVVGVPRNLSGQDTAQTRFTEKFIENLRHRLDVPLYTQDEALSSKRAEAELRASQPTYDKAAVDALAATLILEDFLNEHPEVGRE